MSKAPGRVEPAVLDEIIRRIVEVAQPERIILFGSAARGDSGPESDVDLLVVKAGVEHRRRLAQDIDVHLAGLGVGVDVVVATPDEVEYLKGRVGSVIRRALREGREIYVNLNGRESQRVLSAAAEQRAPQDETGAKPMTPLRDANDGAGTMPPGRDPSDPREWLRRARSKLGLATLAPARPEILYDDLCFDAQQAAEKAVKAVRVARQEDFPKTHNIGELLDLVGGTGIAVPADVAEARRLTRYAVGGRYPRFGEDASSEEWRRAAALAERVVRWAESVIAVAPEAGG